MTHNVWLQVAAELGIFGLLDVRVPGRSRALPRELRGAAPAAAARASGRASTGARQVAARRTRRRVTDGRGRDTLETQRQGHAGGDGRLDRLRAFRVGRVQLDVLLRARARGRAAARSLSARRRRAAAGAARRSPPVPRAAVGSTHEPRRRRILVDARTPVQLRDVRAGAPRDARRPACGSRSSPATSRAQARDDLPRRRRRRAIIGRRAQR